MGSTPPSVAAVEPVEVARSRRDASDHSVVVAALVALQCDVALVLAQQMDLDLRAVRGPDGEAAVIVPAWYRAEALPVICQV